MARGGKGDVVIKIRVDDAQAAEKLRRVAAEIQRLGPAGTKAAAGVKSANANVQGIGISSESTRVGMFKLTGAFTTAFLAAQMGMGILGGLQGRLEDVAHTAVDAAVKVTMVADDFEKMGLKLSVLLGSVRAGEAAVEWIKEFAVGKPFEVRDITKAAITLEAFSIDFREHMETIGDTASLMEVPLEHAAEIFGRFSVGMYNTRFLAQIGLSQKKLKEWGLEFSKAGELITDADVAFQRFMAGLKAERGGLMAQTAETLTAKLSDLQDVYDLLSESIGRHLLPAAKDLVDTFTAAVQEIKKSGDLEAGVQSLADAYERNRDLVEDIIALLPEAARELGVLVAYAGTLLDYVGEMNREWRALGTEGPSAVEGIATAMEPVLKMIIFVAEYTKAWINTIQTLSTVKNIWEDPVEFFKALGKAAVPYTGIVGEMEAAWAKAGKIIYEKRAEIWERQIASQKEASAKMKAAWREGRPEDWYSPEYKAYLRKQEGKPPPGPGAEDKGAEKAEKLRVEWRLAQLKKVLDYYNEVEKINKELRKAGGVEALVPEPGFISEEGMQPYLEWLKKIEEDNKRIAASWANDIGAVLQGTDVKMLFADRLGRATYAALSDAIEKALALMGAKQILTNVPIIGPFLGALQGLQEGAIVRGGRGGVPAIIGEGRWPELVLPMSEGNIATMVRGISRGIKFPEYTPQFVFQGLDPRDFKIARRAARGARALAGRTW